jgi:hypothetical protein
MMMSEPRQPNVPIFVHFFDWFRESTWNEAEFVEALDWKPVGTSLDAYGTIEFFQKQFEYIRRLGIDNIAWQFNGRRGGGTTVPAPAALQALRNARIAPVYDLELTFRLVTTAKILGLNSLPRKQFRTPLKQAT